MWLCTCTLSCGFSFLSHNICVLFFTLWSQGTLVLLPHPNWPGSYCIDSNHFYFTPKNKTKWHKILSPLRSTVYMPHQTPQSNTTYNIWHSHVLNTNGPCRNNKKCCKYNNGIIITIIHKQKCSNISHWMA